MPESGPDPSFENLLPIGMEAAHPVLWHLCERIRRLEAKVASIDQAEQDLANVVASIGTFVSDLQTQVTTLQTELANAQNPSPALQAAADAIEAQVAKLAGFLPAPTPAPAPAPAPGA